MNLRGLFLYGANCTPIVWDKLREALNEYEIDYAQYPHSITETAEKVSDLTRWVAEHYNGNDYDFIVGHSMGGIIALELAADYGFKEEQIILIESNLKPAKEFYRNLMLPSNMQAYGESVIRMIKGEAPYYSEKLKKSLQEEFDYTGYAKKLSGPITAIYGDRGQEGYEGRIEDLCLDEETVQKMDFKFVKNSCHMPMIENSAMLRDIIIEVLNRISLPVKYRTLQPEDAENYWTMMNQLDSETKYMMYEPGERKEKSSIEHLRKTIENAMTGGDFLLAAEIGGKLVGYIFAERGFFNRIRHTAYIVTGILAEYRGKGIGSEFFRRLDCWAVENRITRLELTVMCPNKAARRLYEKNGFVVEGLKKNSLLVDGEYVDEYYMSKVR